MSKIGRMPIELGGVQVEVDGSEVKFQGKNASGVHVLPSVLTASVAGKKLKVMGQDMTQDVKRVWGLHRALLANKIKGADVGFEKRLKIVGLGYKAVVTGNKMQFSLGYSHKIDFELPQGVTVEVDKSGQNLIFRSSDKILLGSVASKVRAFRKPEPYKGTGIMYIDEVILRKAGKAKSA